jgi:hypothetical protein
LFSPRISAGAEAVIEALAHVAVRAPESVELEYLPHRCLAELVSWEAEQHRKTMDGPSTAADGK